MADKKFELDPVEMARREARGLRCRAIRLGLNLSRPAFCRRYGFSQNTLQNWEDCRSGGLIEGLTHEICNRLEASGIHISFDWLFDGIGEAPRLSDFVVKSNLETNPPPTKKHKTEFTKTTETALIHNELDLFRKNYHFETLDMIVKDDGMAPLYEKGEHVAGIKYHEKQMALMIGKICITQTHDKKILLRQIQKGDNHQHYHLICTNSNTKVNKPILYNIRLQAAAPVCWVRRRNV